MITLMLAWVVVFLSVCLPIALLIWIILKGGRATVENTSRHEAVVREVVAAIPGNRALAALSRISSVVLAILVLVNG